jgi:hypothetical protein
MTTLKKETIELDGFSLSKVKKAGVDCISKGNTFSPELSKEFSIQYQILLNDTPVANLQAIEFHLFEDEFMEEKEEFVAELDYLIDRLETHYSTDSFLVENAKEFILNNKVTKDFKFIILQELEVLKDHEGKGFGSMLFNSFLQDNVRFSSQECLAIFPGCMSGRCGRTTFTSEYEMDTEELAEAKEELIHKFYIPQLNKHTNKAKLVSKKHYRFLYA